MILTENMIEDFKLYLVENEKSRATIEKYIRDVTAFYKYAVSNFDAKTDKRTVINYKLEIQKTYKKTSVNSMISSINSFFVFLKKPEMCVKTIKIQRDIFASKEKELTKAEYKRLLAAAGNGSRLYFIIMTICAAGIRVSELKYITVESLKNSYAEVSCKGKTRRVMLPRELCDRLKIYVLKRHIKKGSVFITGTGKPVNRVNIWSSMKKLCKAADVREEKVFPHNLRHLFAVTFYAATKDIVKLADILGHSSMETTRIYTIESGINHRRILDKMQLVITDCARRRE